MKESLEKAPIDWKCPQEVREQEGLLGQQQSFHDQMSACCTHTHMKLYDEEITSFGHVLLSMPPDPMYCHLNVLPLYLSQTRFQDIH